MARAATGLAVILAALAAQASPASALADFSWNGQSSTHSQNWSDGGNWQGGTAPSGTVGTLSFPAAVCAATPQICASTDNVPALTADTLSLVTPTGSSGQWNTSGTDTLTLNSALSSTLQGSGTAGFSEPMINLPIALGGNNTWTIDGAGVLLGKDVSGSHTLAINLANNSFVDFGGASSEVGAVTIAGDDATAPAILVGTPGTPGDLNGTDGNTITVTHRASLGGNGTVGPLTVTGGIVGPGTSPGAGTLAVQGNAIFDPASALAFANLAPGAPGTNYPQLTTTGNATLDGAQLRLLADCGQSAGTVYTLVQATGAVSGMFAGTPDGSLVQSAAAHDGSCSGSAQPPALMINYTTHTVTAKVVPGPAVQAFPPSNVTQTTATLRGSVNPNGFAVTNCHFEYGVTTAYVSSVPCAETVGSGSAPVSVSAPVTGLAVGATYHVRLVATSAAGTEMSQDVTFTTIANAPPVPGSSQLVRADCLDEHTGGLWLYPPAAADTRPMGSYCQRAATALGYDAFWDEHLKASGPSDVSAQQAANNAPADAIFYFAGHSIGCWPAGDQDAGIGMLFVANEQPSMFLGAYHDLGCIGWSVPNAMRDASGVPVLPNGVPLVYRAPDALSRARLVVIQACFSMADTPHYEAIGNQVFDAGAGTVVGFDAHLPDPGLYGHFGRTGSFRPYGDAWSAGFWQAIGAGKTVSEAVDAGVALEWSITQDATDRYLRPHIIIRQRAGAPDPIPAAGSPVAAAAKALVNPAGHPSRSGREVRLDRALRRFLHRRLPGGIHWTRQAGLTGTEYAANVPGVGLFVLRGPPYTVREAIFDPHGRAGASVSHARARRLAATFVARHRGRLSRLVIRRDVVSGQGRDRELDFLWQARRRGIWLPTYVEVIVRGNGSIATFTRDATRVKVSLVPKVSRRRAGALALRIVHAVPGVHAQVTGLAVRNFQGGAQKLIWMVSVVSATNAVGAPYMPIWIDARTGAQA